MHPDLLFDDTPKYDTLTEHGIAIELACFNQNFSNKMPFKLLLNLS
jgi:hypothetical protein